ncbi:MAG: M23 family metallopeptidase [Bacteroidales bacterium]|nr:M23 family metallopeptidase [Bacteroidales bacterium]
MFKTILLVVVLLIFEKGDRKSMFTSPLDIPLSLSANFAELRPGHFHSGLDFKTSGVSGKRVLAVEDGYIYRISVSPGGFGNAVYIRHSNGYSSVYGHLDRFMPDIEHFVTQRQYKDRSFSVNLFPAKDQFLVKKGEQIAYSGNTGSSMGPHLHFEIRRSSNEHPVDPLSFFEIEDNIKPVIKLLSLYPLTSDSEIEGANTKLIYSLSGSKGIYRLRDKDIIEVHGEFGVGISNYDFLNNSWNKCGSKSIKLSLDNEVYYKHSLNEFSFGQTRYINSHIDYEEYINSSRYFQKAFVEPNNFLAIYDTLQNNGIILLNDSEIHSIKLEITDYSDNISVLEFSVKSAEASNSNITPSVYNRIMPFNNSNEFHTHDIRVDFPSDAFYDTLYFEYRKVPSGGKYFSDIHSVHKNTVPVHNKFILSIKADIVDSLLFSKAGIVKLEGDKEHFIGGEFKEGFIVSSASELGDYAVAIDTIGPEIAPYNFRNGENISGRDKLKIRIEDDFSGITDYQGYIDDQWALFEWDPKSKTIAYVFSKGPLKPDSDHKVRITVSDARNNLTDYEGSFYW